MGRGDGVAGDGSRRRRRDGASLTGPSRPRLARRGARDASVSTAPRGRGSGVGATSYRGARRSPLGGDAATRQLESDGHVVRAVRAARSSAARTSCRPRPPGSAAPRAPRGDSWGRLIGGLPLLSTRRAHEEPHRSRLFFCSFTQTVDRVRLGPSVRLEWRSDDAGLQTPCARHSSFGLVAPAGAVPLTRRGPVADLAHPFLKRPENPNLSNSCQLPSWPRFRAPNPSYRITNRCITLSTRRHAAAAASRGEFRRLGAVTDKESKISRCAGSWPRRPRRRRRAR